MLVNTHPIIEDCSQLSFYRNRSMYLNMNHDLELCGLIHAACWNNVIDFRYVATTRLSIAIQYSAVQYSAVTCSDASVTSERSGA